MSEPKSIVDQAIEVLRTLGVKDRPTAERLLSSWSHLTDITDAERAEVLAAFEEPSIVDRAVQALRSWSTLTITPEGAATLLSSWKYAAELTPEQRAEVLSRFGPDEHIDSVTRCAICTRLIEHIAGIKDPFWRHVDAAGGPPHAARPGVQS